MIVRSIKIGGWRCFLEEVAVEPLQEGMHVFCAPNGSGKSTILEALGRALLDAHRVTGESTQSVRGAVNWPQGSPWNLPIRALNTESRSSIWITRPRFLNEWNVVGIAILPKAQRPSRIPAGTVI